MKPNYKELAAKYRDCYYHEQERISFLVQAQRDMTEHLTRSKQEINELKCLYAEALDKIIALQEKIVARGEENEK